MERNSILEGHQNWVRDVAWAPNAGLPYSTIATCCQDGTVFIWTQTHSGTELEGKSWSKKEIITGDKTPVWRVSWSVTGNILAISSGDNTVSLWKEFPDQGWKSISVLNNGDQ